MLFDPCLHATPLFFVSSEQSLVCTVRLKNYYHSFLFSSTLSRNGGNSEWRRILFRGVGVWGRIRGKVGSFGKYLTPEWSILLGSHSTSVGLFSKSLFFESRFALFLIVYSPAGWPFHYLIISKNYLVFGAKLRHGTEYIYGWVCSVAHYYFSILLKQVFWQRMPAVPAFYCRCPS